MAGAFKRIEGKQEIRDKESDAYGKKDTFKGFIFFHEEERKQHERHHEIIRKIGKTQNFSNPDIEKISVEPDGRVDAENGLLKSGQLRVKEALKNEKYKTLGLAIEKSEQDSGVKEADEKDDFARTGTEVISDEDDEGSDDKIGQDLIGIVRNRPA